MSRHCKCVIMRFSENAFSLKQCFAYKGIAMLTKIGNQVLNELKSELDSDVEDKKFSFMLSNGRTFFRELCYWADKCFFVLGLTFSLVVFFTLCTIDATTIESLKQASVEEWLNARSVVLTITLVMACVISFITILSRLNRYKTAKARYEDENDQYMTETKHHIELIEEVLYRHKLIVKQDN